MASRSAGRMPDAANQESASPLVAQPGFGAAGKVPLQFRVRPGKEFHQVVGHLQVDGIVLEIAPWPGLAVAELSNGVAWIRGFCLRGAGYTQQETSRHQGPNLVAP